MTVRRWCSAAQAALIASRSSSALAPPVGAVGAVAMHRSRWEAPLPEKLGSDCRMAGSAKELDPEVLAQH
jgi:hypothetical protein